MKTDLFISYAWTTPEHREWVRLLASQLHLLGYNVMIDAKVDYGSSLSGFMKKVIDASHVLLIIDENYVDRADNRPESGVATENKWISEVFKKKHATWLSVLFVRNPKHIVPIWLEGHSPKGFNFNSNSENDEFPGAVQIDELWRWIEGLPVNDGNALTLTEVRKRAGRIERINAQRDSGNYVNPATRGQVRFRYSDHPCFTVGHGEYEFKIMFSGRNINSVTVYVDCGLESVGLITTAKYDPLTVDSFLTPARTVGPLVDQSVVLMNSQGALCVIRIDEVQREVNTTEFVPAHVVFSYEILTA